MRHRSRSRNYDSNDNYKSRRSPVKYESSRSHKTKSSHYSSETRKHDSNKITKSGDRSRYDNYKDHDSESEDKYDKKGDRDSKKTKYSKYSRGESPVTKHSRKYDDYTHSYRRRSISSDASYHSYDSKYRKYEEKSDKKNYKSSKDPKRSKVSRSLSSDQMSDTKIRTDSTKDKIKDKKLKKKSKKSEKDKEKKKRKRQKHSSEEEQEESNSKRHIDEKAKLIKNEETDDQDSKDKSKIKLEPFKVKESSNLKSQINFLNSSSSIFTKDEWQKESSDDDLHKKKEDSRACPKKDDANGGLRNKSAHSESDSIILNPIKDESVDDSHPRVTKSSVMKKQQSEEAKESKDVDKERARKRRHRASHSKTRDSNVRSSKEKSFAKSAHDHTAAPSNGQDHSHSYGKSGDSLKSVDRKDKLFKKEHKSSSQKEDKKKIDDVFDDERIELPRTPTDAQYTGLFARLQEEPVSDTEIEDILPPILLDDKMKALLVNDPNVIQEAWDSEDDALLTKRENIVAARHRGVLETLAVPWKLLIGEASLNQNKQDKHSGGLSKFTVPNLLSSVGISKQLSGDALWAEVQTHCSSQPFLNPIPPIHQTLLSQKSRRTSIFCERGLFAGALSARKDLFIRRVLYEPII